MINDLKDLGGSGAFRSVTGMANQLGREGITVLRWANSRLPGQNRTSVLWTPDFMNGGNFLYLWLNAWAQNDRDMGAQKVLYVPKMDPWLREFPALEELTIRPEELSLLDRRILASGQNVGVDFKKPEILPFVRELLLKGSPFLDRVSSCTQDALVINVRRGDYYSVEKYRRRYGMNIRGFVESALEKIPPKKNQPIVLVSDDPDWCMKNLGFLGVENPLSVMPGPHDMFQDLAQLVAADHLLLANSTFSYWGGYLASAQPPGSRPRVIQVPHFYARDIGQEESTLLLDQWMAVDGDEYNRDCTDWQ